MISEELGNFTQFVEPLYALKPCYGLLVQAPVDLSVHYPIATQRAILGKLEV